MKIEEKVVNTLKDKSLHISFAESMTGGMLASTIINVSGASNVIERSFVTYSNLAKCEILNVSMDTINKYDVVSIEVVKEMVNGLSNISKSDVNVSVSGYANGYFGKDAKGKVCYAIKYKDNIYTNEVLIDGDRNKVRKQATHLILSDTYKLIK